MGPYPLKSLIKADKFQHLGRESTNDFRPPVGLPARMRGGCGDLAVSLRVDRSHASARNPIETDYYSHEVCFNWV